jgi:hypothetical protein
MVGRNLGIRQSGRTRGDRDLHVAPQADESRNPCGRGRCSSEDWCAIVAQAYANGPLVRAGAFGGIGHAARSRIYPHLHRGEGPLSGRAVSSPRHRRPSGAIDESVLDLPRNRSPIKSPSFPEAGAWRRTGSSATPGRSLARRSSQRTRGCAGWLDPQSSSGVLLLFPTHPSPSE